MPANMVPPGWYQDPEDRRINRYWNGQRWTEQTSATIGTTAQVLPAGTSGAGPGPGYGFTIPYVVDKPAPATGGVNKLAIGLVAGAAGLLVIGFAGVKVVGSIASIDSTAVSATASDVGTCWSVTQAPTDLIFNEVGCLTNHAQAKTIASADTQEACPAGTYAYIPSFKACVNQLG